MKKQLLKTFLLAGITAFFFACSSGGGNNSDQAEAEAETAETTDEASDEESADGSEISQVMVVWHEVKDYDAWKPLYDGNSEQIHAGGMTEMVVGRESDNQNNVFVAHAINDLEAARGFADSEDLKTKMEEGGVIGAPDVAFVDVVSYGNPNREVLDRVMIRHRVADWDTWKPVFDADVENLDQHGLSMLFLGRDIDDSNIISVVNVVHDQEKAAAYISSDELKDKMINAGVEDDVDITFFTVVQYADGI